MIYFYKRNFVLQEGIRLMFGWITASKNKIRTSGRYIRWEKKAMEYLKKQYADAEENISIREYDGNPRIIQINDNKFYVYGHRRDQQAQWQPNIRVIERLNNTLPNDWNLLCVHGNEAMNDDVKIYIIGCAEMEYYIKNHESNKQPIYNDKGFAFGKTDNKNRHTYDIHERGMRLVDKSELKHLGDKNLWDHFGLKIKQNIILKL